MTRGNCRPYDADLLSKREEFIALNIMHLQKEEIIKRKRERTSHAVYSAYHRFRCGAISSSGS